MVSEKQSIVFWPSDGAAPEKLIGKKAVGLITLPQQWHPPLFVVVSTVFTEWKSAPLELKRDLTKKVADTVISEAKHFDLEWNAGVILRSSAVDETLADRGSYDSKALTADYDLSAVSSAIEDIFNHFNQVARSGAIAIIVQPLVPGPRRYLGHISNERRVSKTVNQWMLESPDVEWIDRFNSQRADIADEKSSLGANTPDELISVFKSLGRWCTQLNKGPCHIEWAWSNDRLWILQIDFEDDSPDDGVDPRSLIRPSDLAPLGPLKLDHLKKITFEPNTGWPKIDKARHLASVRAEAYPDLYFITADAALAAPRENLISEIQAISNGRAVCRTDCVSNVIEKLNLPRTNSVSPEAAVNFMGATTQKLLILGAKPSDICFIIHRFIPAASSAWVLADPTSQIVRVDSLWGIPDGLQFLPHDTFEYDVKRRQVSSEIYRYKVSFIQEVEDGSWREIKIARRFGRSTSLSSGDVREVAALSHRIACEVGEKIQVMWFCDIPKELGIGKNLPWFRMSASDSKFEAPTHIGPVRPRFSIRDNKDLEVAKALEADRYVLNVRPNVDLIRDDEFLKRLEKLAVALRAPVELYGSILAHAFYMLKRAGITVVTPGEPQRTRIRGKQIFAKLVRDEIPRQIESHGEKVFLAQVPKSESRSVLIAKLFEEAVELLNAVAPDDVEAELADLFEVLLTLTSATGVSWEDIQRRADLKRNQRGGFEKGLVLMETAWPKSGLSSKGARPPTVSLKDLAQSTNSESGTKLNFAALLSKNETNRFAGPDGTIYEIRIVGGGVQVTPIKKDAGESQLPLPGISPNKS